VFPFDLLNPQDKSAKNVEEAMYEVLMNEWLAKYGSLQRPALEILVETSGALPDANSVGKHDIYARLQRSQLDILQESISPIPTDNKSKIITRIHIYDKQHNPYKAINQIMSTGAGEWSLGRINTEKVKQYVAELRKSNPQITQQQIIENLNAIQSKTNENPNAPGAVDFYETPAGTRVKISANSGARTVRDVVKHTAPNIVMGTNGTLVKTANLASKTDGLMGAINIINANKTSNSSAGVTPANTGLASPNGLPLRVVPAQLTMTSLGCPIAQLYQQYFIDFGTGTTIDNLYNCTQVQHTIAPGRFETSWTFAYTDGYGKFSSSPTIASVVGGEFAKEEIAKTKAAQQAAAQKRKDDIKRWQKAVDKVKAYMQANPGTTFEQAKAALKLG